MESEQNSSTLRHYLNLYVRTSGGPLDHSRMLGQLDPNRTLSVGSDDEAARLHQVCRFCGCAAITVSGTQQPPMPVIGWLSSGSRETDDVSRLPSFRLGLNETGYTEGRNVAIEYRRADDQIERPPALAA